MAKFTVFLIVFLAIAGVALAWIQFESRRLQKLLSFETRLVRDERAVFFTDQKSGEISKIDFAGTTITEKEVIQIFSGGPVVKTGELVVPFHFSEAGKLKLTKEYLVDRITEVKSSD